MTKQTKQSNDHKLIGELKVLPKEQPHLFLGRFTNSQPPKGFAIHLNPDPDPDTIVTQINRMDRAKDYELVLYIANYGDRVITAQVWPL